VLRCGACDAGAVLTERLEIRLPEVSDRERFVGLFCDEAFMEYSGVLDRVAAHARFDGMLRLAEVVPFAKQPVLDRETGLIVGYVGVAMIEIDGVDRYEFGWRLVPEARGRGYATEASTAVLELAGRSFEGDIYALIDPGNVASRRVARKLGFRYEREAVIHGDVAQLHLLRVPTDHMGCEGTVEQSR
jgi:RimJ/RimL family protein N-acetyltransferase